MNLEKYVEALQILPKISGIYEDTLKEYVANHKFHFFWFRWRQRWKFEKREMESLSIFFDYLNSLIEQPKPQGTTETKPTSKPNFKNESNEEIKNKLENLFSNLSEPKTSQPTPPNNVKSTENKPPN